MVYVRKVTLFQSVGNSKETGEFTYYSDSKSVFDTVTRIRDWAKYNGISVVEDYLEGQQRVLSLVQEKDNIYYKFVLEERYSFVSESATIEWNKFIGG